MTLGDVLNIKSKVKYSLQKHKGSDYRVYKQRKTPLSAWDCIKMYYKAFAHRPDSV